jgi:large subunit ribosomal protein L4
MSTVAILNQKGKKVDTCQLDKGIFDRKVNTALLHQAVTTYLANQRRGRAATKTRGLVAGGGAKPWRQKGTGRARVGSRNSPLWRGGGTTFGPQPRDYSKDFPRRMKLMALKSALNDKLRSDAIVVLEGVTVKDHKTRQIASLMKSISLQDTKVTLVVESLSAGLKLACRNMALLQVEKAAELSAYTVLNCKVIVFTRGALDIVQERVKKWLK